MNISYFVADPTKNITVLVSSAVPVDNQPAMALALLEEEPTGQQVGYISDGVPGQSDITLRMAGGEFCGNATMSTAALYIRNAIQSGEITPSENPASSGEEQFPEYDVVVNASGAESPVKCHITATDDDSSFVGKLMMPSPKCIEYAELTWKDESYKLPVVKFDGISHVIFFGELPKEDAEAAVVKWAGDLRVEGLGIMFFDLEYNTVTPVVYVKNPETLYWESSCGSGSTAVAAYLFSKAKKDIQVTLREPGGNLSVEVVVRDGEAQYFLEGHVSLSEEKSIHKSLAFL